MRLGPTQKIDTIISQQFNDLVSASNETGSTDLFVDVARNDSYVADGTRSYPYKSIAAALASITDAGPTKPYVLLVAPGVYAEGPLTLSPYVKLCGSGWLSTVLMATDLANHFITMQPASVLRDVGIYGPTGVGKACIYHNANDARAVGIAEVTLSRGYYGVYTCPSTTRGSLLMSNVLFAYAGTSMHTFLRAEGYGDILATGSIVGAPDGMVGTAFCVVGSNAVMTLNACYHRCGLGVGACADDGALLRVIGSVFSNGSSALYAGSDGSPTIHAEAVLIHRTIGGGYTNDIDINTAAAIVFFTGSASRDRINNTVGATLSTLFQNRETASLGACVLGELHVGATPEQTLPMISYGKDAYLSGLASGGAVTRNTSPSRVLNVAQGRGYINDGVDPIPISWSAGTITIDANHVEYVYVNAAGILSHSVVQPAYATNIVLAQVVTNATDVVLLTRDEIDIKHSLSRIQEYFEDVIGPISIDGCVATASATALKLNISAGEFMLGISERSTSGGSNVSFYYVARDGVGGWTYTAATEVDTAHVDAGSGPQHYVNANYYKKDALYVVVDFSGETYYCVYGQVEFATQNDAENGSFPLVPDILSHYGMRIAGIVSKDSAATLAVVKDVRPMIGQNAPIAAAAAADHDTLLNLDHDTHLQYLTTGRAVTWHSGLSGAHVTNGNTHDHTAGAGAQVNHTTLSNIGTRTHLQLESDINTHIANTSNPHATTASQVGLGNVLNVAQIPSTEKGTASGVATLNTSSLVVQNPANATATPTASRIPIADGSAKLDGWISSGAIAATPSLRTLGTGATEACAGNDTRLSNARTPTAHASTHTTTDLIANAIPSGAAGLMSGSDKAKLDSFVFGMNYQSSSEATRTTHTGDTNFVNKITLTTPALTGNFRVGWSCVVDLTVTNQQVEAQLYNVTDASILGATCIRRPTVTTERLPAGGSAQVTFTGASKIFAIQYRTSAAAQTAGCAGAHLEFWRVS